MYNASKSFLQKKDHFLLHIPGVLSDSLQVTGMEFMHITMQWLRLRFTEDLGADSKWPAYFHFADI